MQTLLRAGGQQEGSETTMHTARRGTPHAAMDPPLQMDPVSGLVAQLALCRNLHCSAMLKIGETPQQAQQMRINRLKIPEAPILLHSV